MSIKSILKQNLLKLVLTATIIGCNPASNQKNIQQERAVERPKVNVKMDVNSRDINKPPWSTVSEYDEFIRSTVDNYYDSDVNDIYNFYSIKRDLPRYDFKSKEKAFTCFDCEGAVYKEGADSIYFYSTCSEEMFNKYIGYSAKNKEDIKEELTNRIHHYIKHESAHAFYSELGRRLGKTHLFKTISDSTSTLEKIQYTLVEEGVADYMAYKGELTWSAKRLNDGNFKEMIENENDSHLYELGFLLIKPILDTNFEKGIKELIRNPLTKKDLNDLPGYREKRIENIVREF